MKNVNVWLAALFIVFAIACSKDGEPQNPPTPPPPPEPEKPENPIRFLVANEGQYGAGTASLTMVTKTNEVTNDVFRTKNNRPLGDVAQSIAYFGESFYVALNNSRKIEVMNEYDFTSEATILLPEGMIPTYIEGLGGDSAAVADKGQSGQLVIIDTKTRASRRSIDSIGSGNQMVHMAGKLFLAGSTLRSIPLSDMSKKGMKTINGLNGKPFAVAGDSKLVVDKNGKIWALNSKRLICIDPATETVVKEIELSGINVGSWDGRLDINPTRDKLYFTGSLAQVKGVFEVAIDATTAPTSQLLALTEVRVIYNMAMSKQGTIVVCDVEYGSLARGLVHEYSLSGEKLRTIEAGIFPQYLFFLN